MIRRAQKLTREQMFASVPVLNPAAKWRPLDSGQTLVVFEKAGARPVRWARRLFALSETAELLVDETGTRVLAHIDGSRTVDDLAGLVAVDLKLNRKEAENAMVRFLALLGRRSLVGFEMRPPFRVESPS